MSDVIKKLDDSLEAQRDGSRIFDDCKKSFERLIGTNMNANIHFIQNSLQELHAKVNQLSAPSRPPEYVELKKHATHLVASSASITSIVDLLRVILSNQTHLKMLVQHLLSTSNSNNSQNLSYQRDPLSSISQHLSLDHLNKALPNEALQDHTTSTQLLSTQSSTMQSNSTDDLPLTGNDSTDIFRSKSYIPGSVSFPCSTSLEEVTSLNPHSMSTMDQNKPSSSPGGVAATASSKTCTASTVESTTKYVAKRASLRNQRLSPVLPSPVLWNVPLPVRSRKQSPVRHQQLVLQGHLSMPKLIVDRLVKVLRRPATCPRMMFSPLWFLTVEGLSYNHLDLRSEI